MASNACLKGGSENLAERGFPNGREGCIHAVLRLTHLDRLESEAIHILRETVAEAERPVMLYSIGKDSAVMLHLAARRSIPRPCRSRCFTSTRPGNSGRCTSFATRWRPTRRSS
jgi:hypothetical protein